MVVLARFLVPSFLMIDKAVSMVNRNDIHKGLRLKLLFKAHRTYRLPLVWSEPKLVASHQAKYLPKTLRKSVS